jgi:hypothetical protein
MALGVRWRDIAFDGRAIQVDVGCQESDPVWPGDRVLTAKGFATVVGKADGDYWIQTDAAARLGAGLLRYGGPCRVIGRLGPGMAAAGALIPGDIVAYQGKGHFVVDASKQVKIETLADGSVVSVRQDEVAIVMRPDLPAQARHTVAFGVGAEFGVSSKEFCGLRAFPGDRIRVNEGIYTVVGFLNGSYWVKPVDGREAVILPSQAFLDPGVVQLVGFVDENRKLVGE